jgi:hypothetical protein
MSKLDKYPNLKKANEARLKKSEERALELERKEKDAKKKQKKKIVLEYNDDDTEEKEPELDVAAYLSELCDQHLQLAYKEVIKPKIKKQLKKYTKKEQLPEVKPEVVTETVKLAETPTEEAPKRKNLFD